MKLYCVLVRDHVNVRFGPVAVLILTIVGSIIGLGIYFLYIAPPFMPASQVRLTVVPEILYNSSRVEEGPGVRFLIITGMVENNRQHNIGEILVNATFYDDDDNLIDVRQGGSYVKVAKYGQIVPFEILFPLRSSENALPRYTLSASAIEVDDAPIRGVEIVNSTQLFDENGYHVIKGYVSNVGDMKAVEAIVYGVYYDAAGKIVYVSEKSVSSWIDPRVTMPFEVSAKPSKVDFSRFEVLVFARNYAWYYFWRYGPPQIWLFVVLVIVVVAVIVYLKRRGW
jgi:hypothetical protein